jgi:hypothetical protein
MLWSKRGGSIAQRFRNLGRDSRRSPELFRTTLTSAALMSLSRSLALARVARRNGRTFATAADGGDYYAQRAAIKAHAAGAFTCIYLGRKLLMCMS